MNLEHGYAVIATVEEVVLWINHKINYFTYYKIEIKNVKINELEKYFVMSRQSSKEDGHLNNRTMQRHSF